MQCIVTVSSAEFSIMLHRTALFSSFSHRIESNRTNDDERPRERDGAYFRAITTTLAVIYKHFILDNISTGYSTAAKSITKQWFSVEKPGGSAIYYLFAVCMGWMCVHWAALCQCCCVGLCCAVMRSERARARHRFYFICHIQIVFISCIHAHKIFICLSKQRRYKIEYLFRILDMSCRFSMSVSQREMRYARPCSMIQRATMKFRVEKRENENENESEYRKKEEMCSSF